MKERIRDFYYVTVEGVMITLYEWTFRYMKRANREWKCTLAKKILDNLTYGLIDNQIDFNRNEPGSIIDMKIISPDKRSPFYGGKAIHAEYLRDGRILYGDWCSE